MSGVELPKISLVTTCLNQLSLLEECISSVLGQQYPELEYIVIDRGSNDGSLKFLGEFSDSALIVHEEPGMDRVEAVEKGLSLANGIIMGVLDPEEKHFHLGLFRVALIFMSDWKVNWVAGRQARWLPQGDYEEKEFHAWNVRSLVMAYQGEDRTFPQSATFWRRALYDLVGAKFGPGQGDDAMLDLWLRFYEHVDLHSADAQIAGFRHESAVDSSWQEANRTVVRRSQAGLNNANRRSTSPNSLRCVIYAPDFMRLLRETRPGYVDEEGITIYRGNSERTSPPLLICFGQPKSASSFMWKMSCNIAGGDKKQQVISRQLPVSLNKRYMQSIDERWLAILELLPPDVTYAIKTHAQISEIGQALVSAGVAKAVVSVRNPYDLVASLIDVGVSERARPPDKQRVSFTSIYTMDDAVHVVLHSINICREWLQFAEQYDLPVIHFEHVVNQPEMIATRIAGLLGLSVDAAAVVAPFLENKAEKIPEFNVGISGRGRELFENYNNPAVIQIFEEFNDQIKTYK